MTDLSVPQSMRHSETALKQAAHIMAEWFGVLRVFGPVTRTACPAASELTGITLIERHDIAPWLSF